MNALGWGKGSIQKLDVTNQLKERFLKKGVEKGR